MVLQPAMLLAHISELRDAAHITPTKHDEVSNQPRATTKLEVSGQW
jgi:hypothetical protein